MQISIPLRRQPQMATLATLAAAIAAAGLAMTAPAAFAAVAASLAVLAAYALGERAAIAEAALDRQRATVATVSRRTAPPPAAKRGTAAYYRQRLAAEHPALAAQVAAGELSVFAASVRAGLRKPAPKVSKEWTSVEAYMKKHGVKA